MTASTIQVRDARKSNFFWAPNELIKRDGTALGVYGIAVYCALSAFADNENNTAFPSVATLAKTIGCSANKVRDALSKLCDMKWVKSEARVTETDDGNTRFLSNLYYLLPTPGEVSQDEVPHVVSKGTAQGEVGVLHDNDQGTAQGDHDLYPLNNTQVTILTEQKDSLADSAPEEAITIEKPKPRRARARSAADDIFDAVAEVAFCTPPGSPGIKAISGQVGPVAAIVKALGCTAQEYRDICALWLKKNRGLTLPRGTGTTTTMINEYRAAAVKRRALDAEAEAQRSVEFDPEAVMPLTPRIIRDAQGNYAGEPA